MSKYRFSCQRHATDRALGSHQDRLWMLKNKVSSKLLRHDLLSKQLTAGISFLPHVTLERLQGTDLAVCLHLPLDILFYGLFNLPIRSVYIFLLAAGGEIDNRYLPIRRDQYSRRFAVLHVFGSLGDLILANRCSQKAYIKSTNFIYKYLLA